MLHDYVFRNLTRLKFRQTILPERGLLIEEVFYDSMALWTENIVAVEDFKNYAYKLSLKNKLADYTVAYLQQQQVFSNQGLIPDIELPIRMPTAIAGFIGQGGNLRINGSQRIQFGGSQSTDLNAVQTEYTQNDFLPELEMKQQLNVNLQGTIGQKINVFVDHNSEAQADLKNKIRLQYRGDQDELIHLIEMGHTQLSLPGTELIGMPPIQMGLFGIKSEMQIAGVNITAIATKEEGKAESRTFVGRASVDTIILWDTDYIRRQYFWLGLPGDSIGDVNPYDSIAKLIVWVDDNNGTNNALTGAIRGDFHFYTQTQYSDTLLPPGYFDPQEAGSDNFYIFNYQTKTIELRVPLDENYALGVCYVINRRNTPGGQFYRTDTVGTVRDQYDTSQTIDIKVIKPPVERTYFPTWDLQIRNRYSLSSTAIVPGSFELKIYKHNTGSGIDEETQGSTTYLKLLGLDDDDDGYIDDGNVDYDRGFVAFPDTLPFPFASSALLEPDSIIYDTTSTNVGRKYKLVVSYKGIRNVFSLGAMNILEGSEVVTVNGERLVKNVDYTIDYDIGIITFLTDKVNDVNAVVNVDFQYAPFISLADKSLLGVRFDYRVSPAVNIGVTTLYRSVSTKEEHPQLGNEPRNITMATVDASMVFSPSFMTKAVDILPLISSSSPSNLTIRGAVAFSMPNPNTKGFVYLDDMDGNKMSLNLGVSRANWHFGSIPDDIFNNAPTYKDTSDLGMVYWYSPNDWFSKGDLFPNLPETERDDEIQVLSLVIQPRNGSTSSYASLQQCISKTGSDLSQFRYLEVWVYGDRGRVNIDLGYNITEDVARRTGVSDSIGGWNGVLNTEDRNRNGVLDIGEDVGLDEVEGRDSDHVPGDEWNDDYPDQVNNSTYRQLKGTEENTILDTEDLNGDGILNLSRDYVEYTFVPGDTTFLDIDRGNGWRLYKIPLHDSGVGTYVGSPDWERIRYARIWVDSFSSQTDSILFGGISVSGNRWKRNDVYSLDSTAIEIPQEFFEVTTRNNYDDPSYVPPFDPGKDNYGNTKKEQSMAFVFRNLGYNRVGGCYYATVVEDNYNNYRRMLLYIHGEGQDGYFSIKFGGDTLSFYEYRAPIPTGWQELTVDFEKFIDLKKSIEGDTTGTWNSENYYVTTYGANKPSLTKINRTTMSVVSEEQITGIEGELWIDDIRLVSPYRETGRAANLSVGMSFGDVLSVNLTGSQYEADYQKITDQTGSGSTTTNYSGTAIFQGGKIFPSKWLISFPFTASLTMSENLPKFYPGSDIRLDGQESRDKSSNSQTRHFSFAFSKSGKTLNALASLIIDHSRFSYSWTNVNNLSYNRADSSWVKTAVYSWTISPHIKPLNIAGQEIGTFFNNISFTSTYSYTKVSSHLIPDTSGQLLQSLLQRNLNSTMSLSYNLLKPMNITYSVSQSRDLELDDYIFGRQTIKTQRVSARYSSLPLPFIRPTISWETNYSEDSRPELRMTYDTTDIFNVSNTNTLSFNTTISFVQPLEFAGRIRDESKDSAASVGSPQWMLLNLGKLGRSITPVSLTASRTRTTRLYRLTMTPDWKYQLGLVENIDPVSTGKYVSPNDYFGWTYSFTGSSGFNFTYITSSVNFAWSKNTGGNIGNMTYTESVTWPRFVLNFLNFQKLLQIRALENSTVSTGFTSTRTRSGPEDQDPTRKTKGIDFSPLVSVQLRWRNGLSTVFSTSRTQNDIDNLGVIRTLTRQENNAISATLGYTFSAPGGLPLFGRTLRFNSLMTFSINYTFNTAKESYRTSGEIISYRSNYTISPTASYNFSQNATGGLNGTYSINEDRQTGRKIRNVGLNVWAEFRF
ncbi:cell surface protein SprA [candidate division WOR-3 bacterium]|nr:cell surface protein SprA [candidate division WOR-3 bacterium]